MTSRIEIEGVVMVMMIQLDDDSETKTYADELCQENTFLVKRVC